MEADDVDDPPDDELELLDTLDADWLDDGDEVESRIVERLDDDNELVDDVAVDFDDDEIVRDDPDDDDDPDDSIRQTSPLPHLCSLANAVPRCPSRPSTLDGDVTLHINQASISCRRLAVSNPVNATNAPNVLSPFAFDPNDTSLASDPSTACVVRLVPTSIPFRQTVIAFVTTESNWIVSNVSPTNIFWGILNPSDVGPNAIT